ncbi:hypothetical protein EDD22DRAFT_780233 [Suillus occidentalis]|nr:hypothetical protein EDD22DRAFT_780233 [Suillus occidentalis]
MQTHNGNAVVTSSTIYPTIEVLDKHSARLQPLMLTVDFPGILPWDVIDQHRGIPLHISISMEEKYQSLLKPALHATAIDSLSDGAPSVHSSADDVCIVFLRIPGPEQDVPISFLPLPPSFETNNSAHWAHLCDKIENWLVSSVHTSSSQWTWGRDMFWLAFVASNPCFPGGAWHKWNPSISLQGEFIEEWLEKSSIGVDVAGSMDLHDYIWMLFSKEAALFYPQPLLPA